MKSTIGLILLMLLVPFVAKASCEGGVTATTLNFGTYLPFSSSPTDSTSTINVTCTLTGTYTVALNSGNSGNSSTRNMSAGGSLLNYDLFQDSTHSTRWTDVSGGMITGSCLIFCSTNYTVYGRTPASQSASPGVYTDTIQVTVKPSKTGTVTTTFAITSTVLAGCSISAAPLAFGVYTGAQNDATSTISASCTKTTPYNIGLSAGTATGATVTTRRMSGPAGAQLAYSLSQDAGRTVNWGNTVGVSTKSGVGSGSTQSLTVYGRIAGAQLKSAGSYVDTIVATITY
jgi:spore coat protein U-like protein